MPRRLATMVEVLDEVGDDSDVEHAAEEGAAAEDPDVEGAADETVEGAAEGHVEGASGEGVDADASDDGAVEGANDAICSRRSPNSGVWQSWQAVSVHPMFAMAYFFFIFFLRDLLLRMLPLGAETGNMPLSSILEMSNMYSSGSIGVSESEPIANVSTISLYSSMLMSSVDVPMSLFVLSILIPGLDAIDMGILARMADSSYP